MKEIIKGLKSQGIVSIEDGDSEYLIQTGHQQHKVNITSQNKSYEIDFDVLSGWSVVFGIFVYSDTSYANNKNLVFDREFRINNQTLFYENFNTFFIQSRDEYRHYWQKYAKGDGTKVEGSIMDPNTVDTPYDVTIELLLAKKIEY